MADGTKIEWADATANYVNGCSRVSPGCGGPGNFGGCYAELLAGTRMRSHPSREGLTKQTPNGPRWTGEVRQNEAVLKTVLGWKRPRRIFWNAHGDLFHPNVPDAWIDDQFATMEMVRQHTHMVLTKRPERMPGYVKARFRLPDSIGVFYDLPTDGSAKMYQPLPNVWLGTSVEDQARADERIPHLLATPAAKRFLSIEPLLGPIKLRPEWLAKLDWVIVGGESGPNARPMHPDWVRSLRELSADAGVAFFFKQWGEFVPLETQADWDATDWDNPRHDHLVAHNPVHDMNYYRVGKKRAGNLLDGRQHLEFPA